MSQSRHGIMSEHCHFILPQGERWLLNSGNQILLSPIDGCLLMSLPLPTDEFLDFNCDENECACSKADAQFERRQGVRGEHIL
jgi:hypothetical protein